MKFLNTQVKGSIQELHKYENFKVLLNKETLKVEKPYHE